MSKVALPIWSKEGHSFVNILERVLDRLLSRLALGSLHSRTFILKLTS